MISIVMPVYNTGKYLDESIPSVLKQSYSDFELLCINDASTNSLTLERLMYYKRLDGRITIINLPENRGVAEARNIGLKKAIGEYVIFLDADDVFEPELLAKMYNTLIESDADVCICSYVVFNELKGICHHFAKHESIPNGVFNVVDLPLNGLTHCGLAPWNKLIKTDFLRKNEINFQSLTSCNDVYFSCMTLIRAKRIVYSNARALIKWREREIGQISSNRNPLNLFNAVMKVLTTQECKENDYFKNQVLFLFMNNSIYELDKANDKSAAKELYEKIRIYMVENISKIYSSDYIFNFLMNCYINCSYDSRWWERRTEYDFQLEVSKEKLFNLLKNRKRIILWGLGKRGRAFLRLCVKESYDLVGVADRENEDIGKSIYDNFPIIHTDKAVDKVDLIIASNTDIFSDLKSRYLNIDIVNLEEYCPL